MQLSVIVDHLETIWESVQGFDLPPTIARWLKD